MLTNELKEKMYQAAVEGFNKAYAPYSNFKVGASVLLKDGTIINGCNVENASYGLTNCAERTTLFKTYSFGYRKEDIVCLMVIGATREPISPCGACRQVMAELMNFNSVVILTNLDKKMKEMSVGELLPYSFSEGNLNE